MDPHASGRIARSLETLHAMCYFAPEVEAEITALGVRRGRGAYFAGRSAPMGAVGAGPVVSTFYVFSPGLVAKCMDGVWGAAAPGEVYAARLRGVDAAYRRLLGDDVVGSPEMAEVADLLRTAAAGCAPEGRALYAAHAELDWPTEPHLAVWFGLTLLREFRGDGHVAVLLGAQLSGLESLITHTATGKGFTRGAAMLTRGWSEEQWTDAEAGLVRRHLLAGTGEQAVLTEAGVALRSDVEARTEVLAAAPWDALGEPGAQRVAELARPWVVAMLEGGIFPAGVFA